MHKMSGHKFLAIRAALEYAPSHGGLPYDSTAEGQEVLIIRFFRAFPEGSYGMDARKGLPWPLNR